MASDHVDVLALLQQGREEEFLEYMRSIGEFAARQAAQLPQWDELATESLVYWQVLQSVLFESELGPLSPLVLKSPASGSWLATEAQQLQRRQLNTSHCLVLDQAQAYAVGLCDQLRGLSALMLADPPVRPAMAIARVLLDAAAQLAYLLDEQCSPTERSARAANIRLTGLFVQLQDLHPHSSDSEASSRLQEEIEDLYARGCADGQRRVMDKKGKEQRYFEPSPIPTQDMTGLLLGDLGRRSWRVLSSVVHVQDRPSIQFTSGRGRFGQEVHGRRYAALDVAPSVVATAQVCLRLTRALGLSDEPLAVRSQALSTLWARAAGVPLQ